MKYKNVNPELKEKIFAYNKRRKAVDEKAGDFQTILDNLPPGQVKNLLKDPICGPILEKYGLTRG